jgi:hypothetical protein
MSGEYLGLWIALIVVAGGLSAWVLMLHSRLQFLRGRYSSLVAGFDPGNLESITAQAIDMVRQSNMALVELRESTVVIDKRLHGVFHGFGLVRFNAYNDVGGEQSFALALLNRSGDGLVISALNGRAETRLYAKFVEKTKSVYNLSDEEDQAIAQAMIRIRQLP